MILFTLAMVLASADGPSIRHEPLQPQANMPVAVTLKGKNIAKATLKLQAVAPGQYIRKGDPAYEKEWVELPMTRDGSSFTVRVPESYQKHRWLLRYRIAIVDQNGKAEMLPKADDASPNFAWWCDNGPAAWSGSRDPGKSPVVTYSAEFQATLQSLHLLAKSDDVAKSQWDGNAHKQRQQGTIVYRCVVYDHIQFSNRGQGSAHIGGKNKWNLKFNKGHEVPFVDHDGVPFPDGINGLSLNPGGSTPWSPALRGITGLDEVMTMRSYRLAGVPSPPATWIQWRVVDRAEEVNPKNQFQGDLWGVYVAIGEMSPKLLADSKLPDGLTVSIQSGIKHTPATMTDGEKQWEAFYNTMKSNPKEDWWRANLDLKAYFRFHALNRLLGNVDLRPDGNHGYYRSPDGHWSPIPWDNDMMFVPRHHQPGYIDAAACLNHPKILLEYRNAARELLDLFASDRTATGGQVGQLTLDLGQAIQPKGQKVDWSLLDAAVWNQHPRNNQKGSYFVNPYRGEQFGGKWTRKLATNDFAGFEKYIIDFCTDTRAKKTYAPNDGDPVGYGWGYLAYEAKDDKIPAKPTLKRQGETMIFQTATPGRVEWRVGEVGTKGRYELTESWHAENDGGEVTIPGDVMKKPGEYRVRVRVKDSTGRCSHWSDAVTVRTK